MKELKERSYNVSRVSGFWQHVSGAQVSELLYIHKLVLNDNVETIPFTSITGPEILTTSRHHYSPCGFKAGLIRLSLKEFWCV